MFGFISNTDKIGNNNDNLVLVLVKLLAATEVKKNSSDLTNC